MQNSKGKTTTQAPNLTTSKDTVRRVPIGDSKLDQIREIVRRNPALIWYTKDYEHLDEESVMEAVLNYGSWQETQKLLRILGMRRAKKLFETMTSRKRCNFEPMVKHYFQIYFKRYAS